MTWVACVLQFNSAKRARDLRRINWTIVRVRWDPYRNLRGTTYETRCPELPLSRARVQTNIELSNPFWPDRLIICCENSFESIRKNVHTLYNYILQYCHQKVYPKSGNHKSASISFFGVEWAESACRKTMISLRGILSEILPVVWICCRTSIWRLIFAITATTTIILIIIIIIIICNSEKMIARLYFAVAHQEKKERSVTPS